MYNLYILSSVFAEGSIAPPHGEGEDSPRRVGRIGMLSEILGKELRQACKGDEARAII